MRRRSNTSFTFGGLKVSRETTRRRSTTACPWEYPVEEPEKWLQRCVEAPTECSEEHAEPLAECSEEHAEPLAECSEEHAEPLAECSEEHAEPLAECLEGHAEPLAECSEEHAEPLAECLEGHAEPLAECSEEHAECLEPQEFVSYDGGQKGGFETGLDRVERQQVVHTDEYCNSAESHQFTMASDLERAEEGDAMGVVSAGEQESFESPDCDSCNTSVNTSLEYVHKPLKDLIYKTNKNIYDVDSRKVQYKAGLSKKRTGIPSLHQNRKTSL